MALRLLVVQLRELEGISVHVIARGTLRAFWKRTPAYADSQSPFVEWYRPMQKASYRTPLAQSDGANTTQ